MCLNKILTWLAGGYQGEEHDEVQEHLDEEADNG